MSALKHTILRESKLRFAIVPVLASGCPCPPPSSSIPAPAGPTPLPSR
jgi:hypothetical protein